MNRDFNRVENIVTLLSLKLCHKILKYENIIRERGSLAKLVENAWETKLPPPPHDTVVKFLPPPPLHILKHAFMSLLWTHNSHNTCNATFAKIAQNNIELNIN